MGDGGSPDAHPWGLQSPLGASVRGAVGSWLQLPSRPPHTPSTLCVGCRLSTWAAGTAVREWLFQNQLFPGAALISAGASPGLQGQPPRPSSYSARVGGAKPGWVTGGGANSRLFLPPPLQQHSAGGARSGPSAVTSAQLCQHEGVTAPQEGPAQPQHQNLGPRTLCPCRPPSSPQIPCRTSPPTAWGGGQPKWVSE